ncbi:hypothetical protein F2Q69_00021222 [Brassica cretica]|uniref:Uncharacterized protein n=1 Tax=Brassica cretica TaxID=69181 RepID=A0A8S9QF34_BRACR|nr:hypothetical protein F2Q69_00021222 [Brassica cretica]
MVPKVGYHSYTEDTGFEVSRTGRDQVELAGRADSRDGRTRRRAVPTCGCARRRADPRDVSALRRVAFVRDSLVRSLPIFLSVNVLREILLGGQSESRRRSFIPVTFENFAGEELRCKPCAENLAVHSGMTSGLVELAVGIILELVPGPVIFGSLSLFGVDSVIMLALEIFSIVVDIPVVAGVFPSRGRLLRVVLLGEDFHLFFHHDEVRCLVKSVLDCSRFFKGYPLPEFRPVPESFPQSVDCHFVADSKMAGNVRWVRYGIREIASKDRRECMD